MKNTPSIEQLLEAAYPTLSHEQKQEALVHLGMLADVVVEILREHASNVAGVGESQEL